MLVQSHAGRIRATCGGPCRVSVPVPRHGEREVMKKGAVQFETKEGGTYKLIPSNSSSP